MYYCILVMLFCFQIRKMDLEARNLQPSIRAGLLAKIREYKSDLNNLKGAIKRISSGNAQQGVREELLESGMADALGVCYLFWIHGSLSSGVNHALFGLLTRLCKACLYLNQHFLLVICQKWHINIPVWLVLIWLKFWDFSSVIRIQVSMAPLSTAVSGSIEPSKLQMWS